MTLVDEIRDLAERWIALWRATWKNPDDPKLDEENDRLYSTALAWMDLPVVPEVVIQAAEWLCVAAEKAQETFDDCDEDELVPEWVELDRKIIALYKRLAT